MGKLTTKTVKVPQSKAEEWDEYIEETPEVDSVSHLIRLSVQHEMSGHHDEPQTASTESSAAPSAEVMATLRDIKQSIEGIDERLSAIERVDEAESSFSLKRAIYSFLPETAWSDSLPDEQYETDDDIYSSRELANKLGADIGEVEETLRGMAEEMEGHIHIKTMDDGRIFVAKEYK